MNTLPPCYGIIPARYDSSRFPGKPLASLGGKPMFWHVYTRACACPLFKKIVLATDDERIEQAAQKHGVPVLMTSTHHSSGTDRVLEATELLSVEHDSIIVNIQGDEPCLNPEMFTQLLSPFVDQEVRITTLASRLSADLATDPDRVKVVLATNGNALYFSRATIPFHRDKSSHAAVPLLHIGLYAFRLEALQTFAKIPQGALEKREGLEQLRLLEAGIPLRVIITEHSCHGVDRPEDLEIARKILLEQSQ